MLSRTLRKSRFFHLHPDTNSGKVERLNALHREYVAYVRICIRAMFEGRRLNLSLSEKQAFFPRAEKLTSHVEKNAIASKAPTEEVNPAYTSQECPSCGYVSRGNRSGTQFRCRSCGRKAHADWVGASGVLRRSQDKDIGRDDHPRTVGATLRRRYRIVRNSPVRSLSDLSLRGREPIPLGRSLTIGVSSFRDGTGIDSNLAP